MCISTIRKKFAGHNYFMSQQVLDLSQLSPEHQEYFLTELQYRADHWMMKPPSLERTGSLYIYYNQKISTQPFKRDVLISQHQHQDLQSWVSFISGVRYNAWAVLRDVHIPLTKLFAVWALLQKKATKIIIYPDTTFEVR